MSTEKELHHRSESKCELCTSTEQLSVYEIPPESNTYPDQSVLLCQTCKEQIDDPQKMDPNHWRCLNDSMWSQVPAVQVMAWRMLTRLHAEGWPQDLLDMLYLDGDTLEWAQATGEGISDEDKVIHKDINGTILNNGDTVVITKDLVIKGANFTAKRGTAVRKISLVPDSAREIEGKVEGQLIVLATRFLKKSS